MDTATLDNRFSFFDHDSDLGFLKRTIELAHQARREGNLPFGAILVDSTGNVLLEQTNRVVTEGDCTGHAETALARRASKEYTQDKLWDCTLYASCEPCAMCMAAIYWCNIGRVVYAITERDFLRKSPDESIMVPLDISCRQIAECGQKSIVIQGPYPELMAEAVLPHAGFWE